MSQITLPETLIVRCSEKFKTMVMFAHPDIPHPKRQQLQSKFQIVLGASFVRDFPLNLFREREQESQHKSPTKQGKTLPHSPIRLAKQDERLSRDALSGEIKFKQIRLVSWSNGNELIFLVRKL